jgi:aspartate-semialdehyde dehydrogenase
VARETVKILGTLGEGGVVAAPFPVSATCTRAAVMEGHTEAVAVSTVAPCAPEDVAAAWREFGAELARLELPSAPRRLITVHEDPFRPQPRLDRDADGGMTTSVGRIRSDSALDNGIKYMLVSHNTKMGAAKGAVLVAEYLAATGYI